MAELGWHGSGPQMLERQVLEGDADTRSIQARCYSLFLTAEGNAGKEFPWSTVPASVESLQFDWAFAVNVLFRLFGDERFAGVDLEAMSYPPLPLRRRIAMDYGSQLLLNNWGREHEQEIKATIMSSVRATEESFTAIGAGPPEGGFADAFSDEASRHISSLAALWDEIKPRLRTFAYETL